MHADIWYIILTEQLPRHFIEKKGGVGVSILLSGNALKFHLSCSRRYAFAETSSTVSRVCSLSRVVCNALLLPSFLDLQITSEL